MYGFDSIILSLYDEEGKRQRRKAIEEKRKDSTKEKKQFFFMKFDNDIDRLAYVCASAEEQEEMKRKQMIERGYIEEVVETVKEVATRTVSGLRRRMNVLKSMKEKKSYSLVNHNNKVLENTLELIFNKVKELYVVELNRIVLAADNATFNRSIFPDTS